MYANHVENHGNGRRCAVSKTSTAYESGRTLCNLGCWCISVKARHTDKGSAILALTETNLRLANYVIINKENTADQQEIATIEQNVHEINPAATIIHADSVVSVEDESMVVNNRVLAVEDGPTLTHGGTAEGAAAIAAEKFGAAELVDSRPGAVGSIRETLDKYSHLHNVVPAMGYSDEQIEELERTISNIDCDVVLAGTPTDLETVIDVEKPVVRVRYEIDERGTPDFRTAVEEYADTLE